jgi:hypothetical protein
MALEIGEKQVDEMLDVIWGEPFFQILIPGIRFDLLVERP